MLRRHAPDDGFYLRPEWLWQDPLPEVTTVLGELLAQSRREEGSG